jgi:hypothetical protein
MCLAEHRVECVCERSHKYQLDDVNMETLESYWSPNVSDDVEQGWEEATDASLAYLLRTLLAKTAKEQGKL